MIKLICAWCTLVINDGDLPASHGLCSTCFEAQIANVNRHRINSNEQAGKEIE